MGNGRGFTLVELTITMALVGIIVALSIPRLNQWQENQRFNGECVGIRSALMLARSTAIDENAPVVMAFDTEGGGGFTLFVDDGDSEQDEGEAVLLERRMPAGVVLYETDFPGGKAGYTPMGLPFSAGSVSLKNSEESRYHEVVLSAAGSVRIETTH